MPGFPVSLAFHMVRGNWCVSIPCLADLLITIPVESVLVSATCIESCKARVQFKVEDFIRHPLHRADVISVLSQAHTVNRRASDSGPYHAHVRSIGSLAFWAGCTRTRWWHQISEDCTSIQCATAVLGFVKNPGVRTDAIRGFPHTPAAKCPSVDNRVQLTYRTGGLFYS